MKTSTSVWIATVKFDKHITKKELDYILFKLATHDNDFNGSNGYVWDEADEGGFDSNLDYLSDKVLSNLKDDEELKPSQIRSLLDQVLSVWIKKDNYYDSMDFDFVITDNTLFVAVAAVTEN